MNTYLHKIMTEDHENGYLHYHAPRYDRLLSLLCKYNKPESHILDIGRSPFTKIAQMTIGKNIDTLGFEEENKTQSGQHFQYDLNRSQHPDGFRIDLPSFDIIIFSEVLEHLYTSPVLVLKFLKTILSDCGVIFLQTPNATVLHKRIKFLLGKNPFNLISENEKNPSHYREYTMKEMEIYCGLAGFEILEKNHENYFDYRYNDHANGKSSIKNIHGAINVLYQYMPNGMKPGLCLVIRKNNIAG